MAVYSLYKQQTFEASVKSGKWNASHTDLPVCPLRSATGATNVRNQQNLSDRYLTSGETRSSLSVLCSLLHAGHVTLQHFRCLPTCLIYCTPINLFSPITSLTTMPSSKLHFIMSQARNVPSYYSYLKFIISKRLTWSLNCFKTW